MDDIFGEIIYIVIMVVIFLVSALRKKKGNRETVPDSERGEKNPMDEVFQPFKDVFSDEEDQETVPEKQPASESNAQYADRKNLDDAPFVKDDYVFTSKTSPGDKRRQRKNKNPGKQNVLKSEQDQPEGTQRQEGAPEWFDLRKAVIFSEILKRPEY